MITDRINSNLSAFFDIEDPVYRVFISDKDGVIPETVTKPTDIDIGANASKKEYLRRLSMSLIKQMFLNEAEKVILNYILNNFFDSLQLQDETDAQWVDRVIGTVFNHKVSRATIILALRPFSSREPVITNVTDQSAFCDFSYADIFFKDEAILDGETIFILPAVAENAESSDFTIKILLYDTPLSDVFSVRDIVDKVIAAGITVQLVIQKTE